jgi:hypothetical protein
LPRPLDEFGDPSAIGQGEASVAAQFRNRLIRATDQRGDLPDAKTRVDAEEMRGSCANLSDLSRLSG